MHRSTESTISGRLAELLDVAALASGVLLELVLKTRSIGAEKFITSPL
jgi:hypothetical protein